MSSLLWVLAGAFILGLFLDLPSGSIGRHLGHWLRGGPLVPVKSEISAVRQVQKHR